MWPTAKDVLPEEQYQKMVMDAEERRLAKLSRNELIDTIHKIWGFHTIADGRRMIYEASPGVIASDCTDEELRGTMLLHVGLGMWMSGSGRTVPVPASDTRARIESCFDDNDHPSDLI